MSTVAIVGLGYVGLPLALAFGKIKKTIGFDCSTKKISQLQNRTFSGDELDLEDLKKAEYLSFTDDAKKLSQADYILVAVPTLVDESHHPILKPLIDASRVVGAHMKKGAIVIYESTVYPGATEEICVTELEASSGLKWKVDFHIGYSPERVNPGDQEHTLTKIVKIVSADDAHTLIKVKALYESILIEGTHPVSCIKVAEAAKILENTQRDLNIALMNELAMISHLVGIDTQEVIDAAASKWNFTPMRPGLVSGHCIGVVPYYLTYKAQALGYHPELILAGRRTNDAIGSFIASQVIKQMVAAGIDIKQARINILGISSKENVQDLSNSKVIDLIKELQSYGVKIFAHDPVADAEDAKKIYGLDLLTWDQLPIAEVIIVTTTHEQFMKMPYPEMLKKLIDQGCFIDLHSRFDADQLKSLGVSVWRL